MVFAGHAGEHGCKIGMVRYRHAGEHGCMVGMRQVSDRAEGVRDWWGGLGGDIAFGVVCKRKIGQKYFM